MKRMEFTFGIITSNYTCQYINEVIDSIFKMNSITEKDFEIIIVGGPDIQHPLIKHIPFEESPKIAFKKNMISEYASKQNIVFLHDYISFNPDWYIGFLEFGNHWDVCMNMILQTDGNRFQDWITWDDPENQKPSGKIGLLAPYSYDKFKYMYISGTYWVAKKELMIREPLNKWFHWGECEDLEWSKRVLRKGYKYKINTMSVVHLLKSNKKTSFKYMQ